MLNTAAEEKVETKAPAQEQEKAAPAGEKTAASKAKPKPAKPKPAAAATNNGPIYLLLSANGKYRELKESELTSEAAGVVKDPSLRLVKGQFMIPQISFKVTDE